MPGGELAIKSPWRMACGVLYKHLHSELPCCFPQIAPAALQAVLELLQADVACPLTSSMGRLFDALAALTGVCTERHYEGQPASLLEGLADGEEEGTYDWHIYMGEKNVLLLDGAALLGAALQDLHQGVSIAKVSARFHHSVAGATAALVSELAQATGQHKVCLTGGCFQNALLTAKTVALLTAAGLQVFTHRLVSPNDEGISYGQAAIAGARKMGI
jgi:hydrogenase maturation protein HypF